MPNNSRKRISFNKKVKAMQKKKSRKPGRNSISFKSVIATGVRTLSSFIPGQAIIRPAVDFLLKTFGLAQFYLTPSGDVEASVTLTGASSSIPFYTGDFFSSIDVYGYPEVQTVRLKTVDGSDGGTYGIMGINWRLQPTGEFGKRCGMWAMAWQPNYTGTEDTAYNLRSLNDDENVKEMTYSTWGPASRGLTLTWRPKLQRDGMSAMPRGMPGIGNQPAAGWLFVAYEDQNRPIKQFKRIRA